MSVLVVATANVQETLGAAAAHRTLETVLEHDPDVVGLQEWYPRRWPLLRPSGHLRSVPGRVRLPGSRGDAGFTWCAAVVGGCVIGVRRERFELQRLTARVLSWPGQADRGEGGLGVEASRVAVVVRGRDRADGRLVGLVGYHLVHGVQRGEGYREDRPRLVARHRREVSRLEGAVVRLRGEGRRVLALGDSNYAGLRLPPLVSAWSTDDEGTGTLGRRRVDDVHAPGPAISVTLLDTPSDHRALVARYDP